MRKSMIVVLSSQEWRKELVRIYTDTFFIDIKFRFSILSIGLRIKLKIRKWTKVIE